MSKIKATDSTLANKLRFVPNKKTIFFPFLCAYVPWSWQTKDNAWQIQVHYFEGKHNFQNMLYSCPLPCWHFLAQIKFRLTRKNKTSFENTIAGMRRIQQTSHSHLGCPYLPPMASIIKKLTRKGYVRYVYFFNDHATLGSVTNEVQNTPNQNLADNICGSRTYSSEGCATRQDPIGIYAQTLS